MLLFILGSIPIALMRGIRHTSTEAIINERLISFIYKYRG